MADVSVTLWLSYWWPSGENQHDISSKRSSVNLVEIFLRVTQVWKTEYRTNHWRRTQRSNVCACASNGATKRRPKYFHDTVLFLGHRYPINDIFLAIYIFVYVLACTTRANRNNLRVKNCSTFCLLQVFLFRGKYFPCSLNFLSASTLHLVHQFFPGL